MNAINTMRNTLLAGLLICSVSAYAQKKPKPTIYGTHTNRNTNTNEETISTDKDGQTYEMTFIDGKMTSFSVDGKTIPAEQWGSYQKQIDEIKEQVKKDREQAEKDRAQAAKDREHAKLDRIQADKDRLQALQDRKQAELDRQQSLKDKAQADRDRAQADQDRKQAEKDRQQAVLDRAQADKDREQADKDRAQADKDRAAAEEERKLINDLVSDLVADKLITAKSDLHELVISDQGMTLNEQQQPDAIYQKYISKYQDLIKTGISYKAEGGNISIRRNWRKK
ncbi:hypothetical protein [Chitinophaga pinensis]|uniref:Uncharacterized protein n=1 Tax=Chitinophaga pinensis (strain ATCC 43595 / DSM 2588 / LMG 13176 / NBRC 15968 / NCIMB 11800 / UQM 2034) TaxID=485918 RepID=A0A979GU11_CHIPD|nr:hypothetical protein [Chitinophaga pinensis]ACU60231.1 hypothetical protein Cpin_2752 [Chitinophaga pinensis DSM 2588]